jgi:hypothetical protein
MPDPAPTPPPSPLPPATPAPKPQATPGHLPLTEEMDSAKWTLPPIVPVLIALAVVAVIVAVVSFANRQKPAASGEIADVQAVEPTGSAPSVLVAINVKVHNTSDRTLYIKTVSGEVTVPDVKDPLKDEAASFVDFDRYYTAFPPLKTNAIDPLKPETRIPPDTDAAGRIVVSFPLSKAQFDARKSLAVRLVLYDQNPVVITK